VIGVKGLRLRDQWVKVKGLKLRVKGLRLMG